jgi:beta-lactamase superfamily II metal-dependent hydrolase
MNNLLITIFDVEQGSSALIKTPNERYVLLDCGKNAATGFTPANHLMQIVGMNGAFKPLDQLILSHADEDHIADIDEVSKLNPKVLARNPSVPPDHIRNEKIRTAGSVERTVETYIDLHNRYNGPVPITDWGGVQFDYFHNAPSQSITALNDLSLVTFVTYGGFKILFPGDLSAKGWQELLYRNARSADFIKHLQGTTAIAASHHGREDGYCEEVFAFAKPMLIIFSDKGIEHETQNTVELYKKHVTRPAKFTNRTGQTDNRYVLTTSNDGAITFTVNPTQFWVVGK